MSTASIFPSPGRPQRHRWTGSEFDRAAETGLFDGQRVELIDGDILETPPMNDPHAQAIQLTTYALLAVFPPSSATVRVQCPMRLGESRPFPDFAMVIGTPCEVSSHPTTALLVIEISDTTLDFDRTEKARLYAARGIADYWIINLNARCVEVYREPRATGAVVGQYSDLRVYSEVESVAPFANQSMQINVSDLLPTPVGQRS